jgi:hypothetical protein
MKKIIAILMMVCFSTTMIFAQPATTPAKKPATETKAASPGKAATPAPATTPAKAAIPTKKDGTPDLRYKANKDAPAGPTKKDGTPDNRYKVNKEVPAKKK